MKKFFQWALVAALVLSQTPLVSADSSSDLMSMLDSMKQQMTKMQKTSDDQNMRLQQLESRKVLEAPQPSANLQPSGSQPSATMSDADFQKSLKDNIGEAIPWMKGAKFGGDLRLRYEAFDYYDKNNDAGSTGTTADRTRNRFRMRLRWGFEKDYGDDWKVSFRIATSGNANTDPNSTNVTLGNPGYFVYKPVWVDRAYANYSPNGLKDYGPIKGVTIGAGKFDNPFLRYSTPIVWDADVTPEGAYEKVNLQLVSTEDTKVNVYETAGQFIVTENAGVDTDMEMYGYQTAVNLSTYGFGTDMPVDLTGAISYYEYTNWSETVNNNGIASFLRTNSIVADNFRVMDIYPEAVFYVNRNPITLWYDYAKNIGNVGTDDIVRSLGNDIHDSDDAWGTGIKIGKAKNKGSWELFWGYYQIGVNAVPAAFNDSDFGGPGTNGFTNRKGHKFGLSYMLTDSISINWTGYVVAPLHPIAAATIAGTSGGGAGLNSASNESVFRSQADVVYKF